MTKVQLARNAAPETETQTPAMAVRDATTLLLTTTILTGTAKFTLQWSNDRSNWQGLTTWSGLAAGFSSLAPVSSIAGGYIRLTIAATATPLLVATVDAEVFIPQFAGGGGKAPPVGPI